MSTVGESSIAPKPKRQLFNRPAWAATRGEECTKDDSPVDVFSRSSDSYKEILAERAEKERKRKAKESRKAEKAEKEAQRRPSSDKKRVSDGSRSVDSKKRVRITDGDYAAFGIDRTPVTAKRDLRSDREESESPTKKLVEQRVQNPAVTRTRQKQATVIELGSSDPEDEVAPQILRRAPVPQPTYEEDEDEEFPELAATAKEKRRQRERDLQTRSLTPTTSYNAIASTSRYASPPPAPDPIIQVLISSDLPNTRALVVHRKLSQRLQEIRTTWCQKQGFTAEMSASVFLIYKMRRLYDVTTCKSLGIEVDSEGRILSRSSNVFESEEDRSRVHVQAVTEAMFEQMKKDREMGLQKSLSAHDQVEKEHADAGVESDEPAPDRASLIRVLLKAKGYKDFKLKVKPSTSIDRMITAFRREYKLSDDAEVHFLFDGERLSPDEEIKDTEIEDMDSVDVHVK